MKKDILVQRYGRGLIDALRDAREFEAVKAELEDMAGLFFTPGVLDRFLASPFVTKTRKGEVLREVLTRAALDPKTTRFLLLLLDKDRLDILPDILEVLPEMWHERQGVLTARVVSAVPLAEAQRRRLKERLESLEGRPVFLTFALDPGLIGGLTVTLDHRLLDVSVKGRAERLRDIIIEG
jgi:F-type H+-transporting ATPase subunit delta